MKTRYRLGIDAGGTFTDFVLADRQGQVRLYKALSTPQDPTLAIRDGMALIAEDLGVAPEAVIGDCDLCINGTTVALNALIQHRGARTGLLCTAGHEDSLEIRLGHKEDGYRYDADYPPAVMLVPRYLRRGVRERVLSDGTLREPLNEEDVRAAAEIFRAEGVESVAVSFVWSVLRPEHERRAAAILREMLPAAALTLGSELYPQIREYTRTSTAVVNAYLAPIMKQYVEAVDGYFRALGARQPVRYFQSNGGLASGQAMTDRPVYAINSGPASAPTAGRHVCEPFGRQDAITIDMGGTSFDITLTRAGSTNIAKNIDFLRYRIGVPMIQVETLGAGGGSVGWIDPTGLMQVGPQSAGADPGPACYGRGGTLPTVSDANLVLGYLNPAGLVGGRLPLDAERAREAIRIHLADPLGLSVERAAYGMFTIVNANMANGIRRVTVERGHDPRDFVLVGAGGATGAHVTALAGAIGIGTIVLPKLASGLCAFGQIISDVKYNLMATAPMRLDNDAAYARIDALFAEIEAQGVARLKADGFARNDIVIRRSLDMRYVGQVHECTVEIGNFRVNARSAGRIRDAFHQRHAQLYTYAEPHSTVEVVNIESTVCGIVAKPARMTAGTGATAARALKGHREAVFAADGRRLRTPIYDGTPLGAGATIRGPAVIEEITTTVVIEPGWTARLDESASYLITRDRRGMS
jgi:N-methylhydantoinase A